MIARTVHLLPVALALAACTGAGVERVRTHGAILADSDRPPVRYGQSRPMPIEEASPFPIDPDGRPAAMAADSERRAPAAPAPRSIVEQPKPR